MRDFAELFGQLDQTTRTTEKTAALAAYFDTASPSDAAWAVYFLSGRKLRRLVPTKLLRSLAHELAEIEPWLFEECYEAVGDLAETVSLIVPRATQPLFDRELSPWIERRLLPLQNASNEHQRRLITEAWNELQQTERLVFNKLLTGAFRVGVSQKMVIRGLSASSGIEEDALSHRLMGTWDPTADFYRKLLDPNLSDTEDSRPYPFFLASPLETPPVELGAPAAWQAEWKWDGIRAQLVKRNDRVFLWSRGEELVTDRFPEISAAASLLPNGLVLDGEILAAKDGQILSFQKLQRRLGLKRVSDRILSTLPVIFYAYDLLEFNNFDQRHEPLKTRQQLLRNTVSKFNEKFSESDISSQPRQLLLFDEPERVIEETSVPPTHSPISTPDPIVFQSWERLAEFRQACREHRAEGVMLKHVESPYRVGRTRGDWWKWKIEPFTIDAVLVSAQRGHGRRASLYTDYSFAVWDDSELVPFAKAYSGLTDAEIRKVDSFVRRNTTGRFGPVRAVKHELVFELAFENIQISSRHKSGVAVRFPRINRWRNDKAIADADTLDTIRCLARGLSDEPGEPHA